MVGELGIYRARCSDTYFETVAFDRISLATLHAKLLHLWSPPHSAATFVCVCAHCCVGTAFSAELERSFAILKRVFGDQQTASLEESVQSMCQLSINNRNVV
jgi:hypothetical protein